MTLSKVEIQTIESSFKLLTKENNKLAKNFYNNLFEMAPLIKPMFKSDRRTIENHFYDLLSAAIDDISHLERFRPRLIALGARHKGYGAKIIHFKVVKAAFMLTIQYELKGKFSSSLEAAWSKYLDIINQIMIEGLSE